MYHLLFVLAVFDDVFMRDYVPLKSMDQCRLHIKVDSDTPVPPNIKMGSVSECVIRIINDLILPLHLLLVFLLRLVVLIEIGSLCASNLICGGKLAPDSFIKSVL